MISLNDEGLTFKALEQDLYKYYCEQACKMMANTLEIIDKKLLDKRDKKKYRCKGLKKTCIQTIMGPVEYSRRIYKTTNEKGKIQHVFLLDKHLKFETVGQTSTNLAEKVVERALEESYRKTTQGINSTTNAQLSHGTAWNIVQKMGSKIKEKEHKLVNRFENGNLQGKREVQTLFQEADGVWLYMQGKDRPSKGRKKEMKIGVS